ncbi:MAG: hypothetical protein M1835_008087 [Candelina submexicana]|nr:MAG: hypothetical protein M1835_008087 [Candelina submexicana]
MPLQTTLSPNSLLHPVRESRSYALSLFRALLRECSYLPDPSSRVYFRIYILSRYRHYNPKSHPSYTPPKKGTPKQRIKQNTDVAEKGLSILRRANSGELKPLEKVLMFTYGRAGKRRQELLRPLKEPDTPADSTLLEAMTASLAAAKVSTPHPVISTKLDALMKSQAQTHTPELTRPRLRVLEPVVPEKDVWERPLAQKRADNIKRKWYADMLMRILPPLPESEFSSLKELATGQRKWDGLVERRIRGRAVKRWVLYYRGGWSVKLETEKGKDERFGSGLGEGELVQTSNLQAQVQGRVSTHPARNRREQPHKVTARLMRRMWGKVLSQCPLMSWDSEKGRWSVEWGSVDVAKKESGRRVIRSGKRDMVEGVDVNGRVVEGVRKRGQLISASTVVEQQGLTEADIAI